MKKTTTDPDLRRLLFEYLKRKGAIAYNENKACWIHTGKRIK